MVVKISSSIQKKIMIHADCRLTKYHIAHFVIHGKMCKKKVIFKNFDHLIEMKRHKKHYLLMLLLHLFISELMQSGIILMN